MGKFKALWADLNEGKYLSTWESYHESKKVKEAQQCSKGATYEPFVQDSKSSGQKEMQTKVQGGTL